MNTYSSSRLVLGTAQLGFNYGIANNIGQPNIQEIEEIVQTAWENKIIKFDTAQGYGNSEKMLGTVFKSLNIQSKVQVITKLLPGIDLVNRKKITAVIEESLSKLQVPKLYGLLLHREEELIAWKLGLKDILEDFKKAGLIDHLGLSLYSPQKAIQAVNTDGISIIQLPTSILDNRFEKSGVFEIANQNNKTIFIRSIFLQGLLLMEPDQISSDMIFAKPIITKIKQIGIKLNMPIQRIALGYLKFKFPKAAIIFGAETHKQVKENILMWKLGIDESQVAEINQLGNMVEERLINPTLWPIQKELST